MVGIPPDKRHLTGPGGVPFLGSAGPVLPGAGMVDFRAVFAAAKEAGQAIESFL